MIPRRRVIWWIMPLSLQLYNLFVVALCIQVTYYWTYFGLYFVEKMSSALSSDVCWRFSCWTVKWLLWTVVAAVSSEHLGNVCTRGANQEEVFRPGTWGIETGSGARKHGHWHFFYLFNAACAQQMFICGIHKTDSTTFIIIHIHSGQYYVTAPNSFGYIPGMYKVCLHYCKIYFCNVATSQS